MQKKCIHYIGLGFFFSPFFSVAATSRMNHQKKRFFSSKFGLSICFIDIRTTTV